MKTIELANKTISTKLPAFVMGILNVTPDSFWKSSRGNITSAMKIIEAGADIIDIGGESTRPGSSYISEQEELDRIIPVIREIRKNSDIPISVDTRKKNVMKAAFEEGADILNDISALEDDCELVHFVAKSKIPVVLMHKRGIPKEMQSNTIYTDVFQEVNDYLYARAKFAQENGVESNKIIIDPGICFGKNLESNVALIKNCGKLCSGQYKIMMALSRKSFIGEMTNQEVDKRLSGTLAANLISVINGASILRVHDVAETIDTMKVLSYVV